MLVQRWGIFWRKLVCDHDRWSPLITVAMKLHNYCIDLQDAIAPARFGEDMQRRDSARVISTNDPEMDAQLRQRAVGNRRAIITSYLENEGGGRPPHAMPNSRMG